jgi:hypothetical protein
MIRTTQLSDVPALVVVFVNWRVYSFKLALPKSVNLGVKSCENKMLSWPRIHEHICLKPSHMNLRL